MKKCVVNRLKSPTRGLIKYLFGLGMILMSFLASSMDINPGEDRSECPGTQITLGGDVSFPTAGPDPIDSYKITWYASPGGQVGTGPNPEITVPDVKTVYKVVVEDKDGFICEETVTITPIIIESISFDPENLPADGTSTSQASAQLSVEGRQLVWKIQEANGSNTSINENSGLVTAGDIPATVKIRAQDKEAADENLDKCYKDENLCVGDPEKCCDDEMGDITFGPVTANLANSVKSDGTDENGYCRYTAKNASINLAMEGFFSKSIGYDRIEGVTVTWKQKKSNGQRDFREVSITWTGDAYTRKFGAIQANLKEIGLSINSDGVISGDVKFTVKQTDDVALGGIAKLAKGTSGTFTYKYESSTAGFVGDYDFSGVKNIKIILLKGSKTIGEAKGSLTATGTLNAKFKQIEAQEFSTSGFTATMKTLNWDFSWDIKNNEVDFKDGNAELLIHKIKNCTGEVNVAINLNGRSATGSASFSNFKAFACEIGGNLSIQTDYEFNIESIEGNGITAKHTEFDREFSINSFKIKEGSLVQFNFSGEAKYKGVTFTIQRAELNNSSLNISAEVIIKNSGQLTVKDFKITGEEGTVSIGLIKLIVNEFPFQKLSGSLSFDQSKFSGSFSGKTVGGVDVGGTVTLGSLEQFNYAFFALEMRSRVGIPIGPVIKVNKFGGKVGYNWNYINSQPQNGTYVVGVLLGVSDVAQIINLEGDVTFQIGVESAVEINGEITVPGKGRNKYLEGQLQAQYLFGTNDVSGNSEATINVPAKTGTAVSLTSSVAFELNQAGWSLATSGDGTIFKHINFGGAMNINAPSSNVEGISGSASGNIEFSKAFDFNYPSDFNPATCETADASDNWTGFGANGNLQVTLSGSFNVALNQEGIEGEVEANASGNSALRVKWPCITGTCKDCVDESSVSIAGQLKCSYKGGTTELSGKLNFTGNDGEAEEKEVTLKL